MEESIGKCYYIEDMRDYRADIIRLVACIAVIMSHFFILTDFNSTAFNGFAMWCQGIGASFLVGSDLYMMLTGYLCCYRSFSVSVYRRCYKIIGSYIIMSIFMIIVKWYFSPTLSTVVNGIKGIFSFTTIPYAWYIEMWLGLFFLSPFLNILFHACRDKNQKKFMILVLFLICCPAEFTNRYGLYILPEYWCDFYPICLYMLGCYARQYSRGTLYSYIWLFGILIILILILCPTLNIALSTDIYKHFLGDRGGIFYLPLSVLIFLFILNIPVYINLKMRKLLVFLSKYSFDIFLSSAIVDLIIYSWIKLHYSVSQVELGWWLPVIVIVIYTTSLILALVKKTIVNSVVYIFNVIKSW